MTFPYGSVEVTNGDANPQQSRDQKFTLWIGITVGIALGATLALARIESGHAATTLPAVTHQLPSVTTSGSTFVPRAGVLRPSSVTPSIPQSSAAVALTANRMDERYSSDARAFNQRQSSSKATSWLEWVGLGSFVFAAFQAGSALGRRKPAQPAMAMMATTGEPSFELFGSQGSRSPLVNWYLHEIGQEFRMRDISGVDRSDPSYPHPFGKIPAARDGSVNIFESGAILMYLADKYGGLDTPEKRAEAGSWIVWANATLDPICFVENGRGGVIDTQLKGRPAAIDKLDEILSGRKWILGDEFSVADVAIGSYLLYVLLFFPNTDVTKWEHVSKYMEACAVRPAYAKAFGKDLAMTLAARSRKGAGTKEKKFGLF